MNQKKRVVLTKGAANALLDMLLEHEAGDFIGLIETRLGRSENEGRDPEWKRAHADFSRAVAWAVAQVNSRYPNLEHQ